ncbi:hypothetical protein N9Z27_03125 [Alphaproteobacteria bacterium]|nr:hypothetical protein [Alphaproteobacteria bacterium]
MISNLEIYAIYFAPIFLISFIYVYYYSQLKFSKWKDLSEEYKSDFSIDILGRENRETFNIFRWKNEVEINGTNISFISIATCEDGLLLNSPILPQLMIPWNKIEKHKTKEAVVISIPSRKVELKMPERLIKYFKI